MNPLMNKFDEDICFDFFLVQFIDEKFEKLEFKMMPIVDTIHWGVLDSVHS